MIQMKKNNNKAINSNLITMKKGGCQWEVAFGRGGIKPQPIIGPRAGREGISIHRHVADLQIKILSKETFKIGVAILKSLIRDRYSSASRSEQRQLYSTVSRVATILTTQFTEEEFWTVGLSLFKVAKKVITQVDELIHIHACIDLSRKFLGDDRQRREVLAAAASVSGGSSAIDSISMPHIANHHSERSNEIDDNESLHQELLDAQVIAKPLLEMEAINRNKEEEKKEELRSLLNQSKESETLELEEDDVVPEQELDFPDEDPDMRLARILTMEELSMEIQAILYRVNQTFAGQSHALANEFVGLQEAIQATLQVVLNFKILN
ncbi:hypothetical protein KC19_9G102200 [Ceratodon purpureus]|uniref:Uncharacterized protein n=1 Tax=Ceratodon purpureus TaxID=3225 RepID=A0A8T0GSK5_CERPU|nr:hypothetical protein KC19_9G102200 [Ceratodon purpureus]